MPHSSALCIPPRSCLCPSPLNGASSSGKQVGEERTKRQEVDTASHVCPGSIQDRAQLYNPSKDCWCEGARRRVLGKQFTKDPSPVSSGWHAPSPPSSFPRFVSPLSAPLSFRLTPTLSFIAAFSPLGFKDLTTTGKPVYKYMILWECFSFKHIYPCTCIYSHIQECACTCACTNVYTSNIHAHIYITPHIYVYT